ncbi:S1C family serine protease [Ornithinimicrobium sediminis]|uniref:S1C family serine protease n=1 Tax=Ornithinimicrobium sediminis TaxID=2904603 RepID=UPI001E438A7C|nr:trypsin-like peptidase domain-containing protein [Ornithinimicrobium sediminis]MCE0486300.1 trypsin-like peptidase domain-containing protein [Ornithinimicrobium sediminis]
MPDDERTQGLPVDTPWSRTGPAPLPPPLAHPAPPTSAHPARQGNRAGRGAGPLTVLLTALLAGLVGGLAGGYAVSRGGDTSAGGPTVTEAVPVSSDSSSGGATVSQIARVALPSVVFITVESDSDSGVGSGFVIREDGYIVTNNHVIEAAADGDGEVTVEFTDGESLPAELVGGDANYDIAVLKVDRDGLPALEFGDSQALQVGAPVVAVGAPLGLDNTVTSGIVSALDRPVVAGDVESTSYINAIQTDAAINPGNSGGPLLDMAARVVGVNSAIAQLPNSAGLSPGGSIGLGFAIPADQAERTASQLIETGTSDYPVMGIHVDVQYAGEGARVLTEATEDVEPVIPGGPAAEAGVRPGDVILEIDGRRIDDSSQLIVVLRSYRIGDSVQVLVRSSDGDERTVSVTLQGSNG